MCSDIYPIDAFWKLENIGIFHPEEINATTFYEFEENVRRREARYKMGFLRKYNKRHLHNKRVLGCAILNGLLTNCVETPICYKPMKTVFVVT